MIDMIFDLLKIAVVVLPLVLLALLSKKANLKKSERSRQCYMPFTALVFCVVAGIFLSFINGWIVTFINQIPVWIGMLADWVASLFDGALMWLSDFIGNIASWIRDFLMTVNVPFWAGVISNSVIITAYVIFKAIAARILSAFCRDGKKLYELLSGVVYYKDQRRNRRYVKEHLSQGITLMKALYIATNILAVIGVPLTALLMNWGLIASLYYPVFSIILVGEIYFFMDGVVRSEEDSDLAGEGEESEKICDYSQMRNVLRHNFGDKLLSENTTVNNGSVNYRTNDELMTVIEDDDEVAVEAYGKFMRRKAGMGLQIDQNYLVSGLDLLRGKSILFNNPFYYDLIPYIFYPMNRVILRRKKVLIVLGRHGVENEIIEWCRHGFASVNHLPYLWNVGVLGDEAQNLDVGIITRSQVHDLRLHDVNDDFFADVEFVMMIEPSKLISTAQIGLNSIVRHCRRKPGRKPVFCSSDKNCDGIVDALSHILMTSLEEVSATNKHDGISSYMCWDVDDEHLQHRMLPNLSRYLGVGTELSFTALKCQIPEVSWYGGEAFPVLDMHWIVKQYHYDLLNYAALPAQQNIVDDVFKTSPSMWNAAVKEYNYLTVEDESCNMFEVKREFATRASNQGFVNVISSDYMLKDYMSENDSIFDADSKAIPYIVADYAPTEKNIIYRICLRLSSYPVPEDEIAAELALIDMDISDVAASLWHSICMCSRSVSGGDSGRTDFSELTVNRNGRRYTFDRSIIDVKRKYSYKTGKMENMYSINDRTFINVFLGDLCSAEYVAEDEKGEKQYLGTELRGHVFQKYLPGQFFTFGGKYYEMLRLSSDGKVVVRRAADHINGRPQYRQTRNYTITAAVDSDLMGDVKDIGGIKVTKQYADMYVDTPSYWRMKRYSDFESAKLIGINGVPRREYHTKQILKIDFTDIAASPKTVATLALLMNEVFRTLYAENQGMIAAVTAGPVEKPLTYSLLGADGFEVSENSIYIIEDSQLDIGLLVSVERNLHRIFSIICDYLNWNGEMLAPLPDSGEASDDAGGDSAGDGTETDAKPPKKRNIFVRFFSAIGRFFKRIFSAIGRFFKKLFSKKPKKEKKPKNGEELVTEPQDITDALPPADGADSAPDSVTGAADDTVTDTAPDAADTVDTDDDSPGNASIMRFSASDGAMSEGEAGAVSGGDGTDESIPGDIEFEADGSRKAGEGGDTVRKRRPYGERYYLLYGGSAVPENLDIAGTLALLMGFGYGNGSLEQARKGRDELEKLEKTFEPNRSGSHYCDFCGVELLGTEYEVLTDGRERCTACGRTAVRTEEEFKKIYETVMRNMKAFYGVVITEPVHVRMVNSKKLHKRLGKRFVPTGKADGRILGVAIKDKEGYSILIENGSPRLKATMTMVHEMTHIWQYLNWNEKAINKKYGKSLNLEIYEGMSKWAEIQYAFLIGEKIAGKREEIITRAREDEYGRGFIRYADKYPISVTSGIKGDTPFRSPDEPL